MKKISIGSMITITTENFQEVIELMYQLLCNKRFAFVSSSFSPERSDVSIYFCPPKVITSCKLKKGEIDFYYCKENPENLIICLPFGSERTLKLLICKNEKDGYSNPYIHFENDRISIKSLPHYRSSNLVYLVYAVESIS